VKTTITNATGERIAGPEPRPGVAAELLDVGAVAALLGCSGRHVYRLADAGRMPRPVRLGYLVRWRRAEVLEWIGGGCQPVRFARGTGRIAEHSKETLR
jgi:excisionase family DNA binding protein